MENKDRALTIETIINLAIYGGSEQDSDLLDEFFDKGLLFNELDGVRLTDEEAEESEGDVTFGYDKDSLSKFIEEYVLTDKKYVEYMKEYMTWVLEERASLIKDIENIKMLTVEDYISLDKATLYELDLLDVEKFKAYTTILKHIEAILSGF